MNRALSARHDRIDPTDIALTLLRAVVGVVFMAHGFLKLTDIGAFEESLAELGVPWPVGTAWLVALVEFVGGIGIFFGCFTRVAALALAGVMVVAIATVHAPHGLMAQNGGFEHPLVLLASLVVFLVAGPGRYSMDHALGSLYEKHRDVAPRDYPPDDRQTPAES